MKKRQLFMYFIIVLFIIILILYAYNAIENHFIKSVDVIKEDLEEKDIIFFQETIDEEGISGKFLTNDGTIYIYNYASYGDKTFEEKINDIKSSTYSKVEKITKKDKGYLNLLIGKLYEKYHKRNVKTDRLPKYIYYVDYDKGKLIPLISSGELVIKNRGLSSTRIISILKKYSIRVD